VEGIVHLQLTRYVEANVICKTQMAAYQVAVVLDCVDATEPGSRVGLAAVEYLAKLVGLMKKAYNKHGGDVSCKRRIADLQGGLFFAERHRRRVRHHVLLVDAFNEPIVVFYLVLRVMFLHDRRRPVCTAELGLPLFFGRRPPHTHLLEPQSTYAHALRIRKRIA
jgi:hypothetical protein